MLSSVIKDCCPFPIPNRPLHRLCDGSPDTVCGVLVHTCMCNVRKAYASVAFLWAFITILLLSNRLFYSIECITDAFAVMLSLLYFQKLVISSKAIIGPLDHCIIICLDNSTTAQVNVFLSLQVDGIGYAAQS